MSVNNYLEIHREGNEYVISDLWADTQQGKVIKKVRGLKSAIEWAEMYQKEFPAEYGIHFGDI